MRISDWSSDVCSSDLRRIEVEDVADALDVEPARRHVGGDENIDVARLEPVEFGDAARLFHVAMNLAGALAMALPRLGEFAHRRLAVAEDDRGCEIGRASWRDRGGRCVEILEVAVALTKKNH